MTEPRELRIVTPRYGPDIVGGTESLVRALGHALVEHGWRVSVWTTDAGDEATWRSAYEASHEVDAGVSVSRWHVDRRRRPRSFALFSRTVFRLPTRLRPEEMWQRLQGPYVPELIRALQLSDQVPTLFTPYLYYPTLAGISQSPHPRILMPAAHDERPLGLRAVGRAIAATDALFFHTPEERDLLYDRYPDCRVLPSAVGTVGIAIPSEPAKRRKTRAPFLYFGGRATQGKGVETLLAGFALARRSHRDLRLVVTGSAADDPAFAGRDGVDALGLVDREERNTLLHDAVATVVPGTLESLSMLALESWAAGRPCIVNGGSAVLAGQAARSLAALVFNDEAEFAAAVDRLIDDPALATRMGTAGRDFVKRDYRWDGVVKRLAGLIDDARRRRENR